MLVEEVDGVDQLAVDVELELVGSAVPDPHGRRAPVALEVLEHLLGQLGAAVDRVHDLERPRLVTDPLGQAVSQPVHEARGLVSKAEPEQRVEREGRVPNPRIAVVPVAAAADLLRQARGRRRDHCPGRLVGEELEDECRAMHRLPPPAAIARLPDPAAPELDRVLELLPCHLRCDGVRHVAVGHRLEYERLALAGHERELAEDAVQTWTEIDSRRESQCQ